MEKSIQTVLSRVRLSRVISPRSGLNPIGLGGTGGGQGHEGVPVLLEVEELLEEEDVDPDDKLTKCVVSPDDWGLKTRLPWPETDMPPPIPEVPLTGELPEVKPSSAELEWRPLKWWLESCPWIILPYSGLWIRVHLRMKYMLCIYDIFFWFFLSAYMEPKQNWSRISFFLK